MHWLKEHGITVNWWEYDNLPASVLDDARMLMRAESEDAQRKQREREQAAKPRGRR